MVVREDANMESKALSVLIQNSFTVCSEKMKAAKTDSLLLFWEVVLNCFIICLFIKKSEFWTALTILQIFRLLIDF